MAGEIPTNQAIASSESPLLYLAQPTPKLEEACTPGTRVAILATITSWINSPDLASSKVLWLADISGSGKSTLARQVGYAMTQSNQLLCSFFFERDIEHLSSTRRVISSMARELARTGGEIAAEIAQAALSCMGAGHVEAFHSQITAPLNHYLPERPSLILIDGLDESGSAVDRTRFLDALVQELPLLPPTVKVMITSNPTQDIDNALWSLSTGEDDEMMVYRLTFDIYGQDNRRDLRKYVSHCFERVARLKRSNGIPLPESWPSNLQRQKIVACANGLFLWATVAADYVACANSPEQALEELQGLKFSPNPQAAMDALYGHILRSAEANPDFELLTYRNLLDVVLSAPNPITVDEVSSAIGRDVAPTVWCLLPVLSAGPFVRIIHQSFRDYIRDSQKCDPRFLISRGAVSLDDDTRLTRSPPRAVLSQRSPEDISIITGFPLSSLATVASYPEVEHLAPDVGDQIVPQSISPSPAARGAFGDIWRAKHVDGRDIAIKSIRLYGSLASVGRQKLEKNSVKELAVWSKLHHPNVLHLLGICVLGGEIGMVSEWMPNGNVTEYTINHPDADKLKLNAEIAAGLAYLHNKCIIHGDLKGGNVVIAADGTARLVDFGLAKLTEETVKFSTTSAQRGTTRWMPHELMNPAEESKAVTTFASDVYALGMTFLEVYTGNPPFVEMRNDLQVMFAVIKGILPHRPSSKKAPQLTDEVWDLMTWCWTRDSKARPNATTVLLLVQSWVIGSQSSTGDTAPSEKAASDLNLHFVPLHRADNIEYLARGSAADVWRISGGRPSGYVAKVLRISLNDFDQVENTNTNEPPDEISWYGTAKAFRSKISQWAPLNHHNVIRVYDHDQSLNLHVEFCSNGCVRDALKVPGGCGKSKWHIVLETLEGLAYLHSQDPPIIHGSLNAGKLFLDSSFTTKIGEFGLASFCFPFSPLVSSIEFSGFSRWMSPEILDIDPDEASVVPFTKNSDIWALACTMLEIFTEALPFPRYTHDIRIQQAILGGELPGSLNDLPHDIFGSLSVLRVVLGICWSREPLQRPNVNSMREWLKLAAPQDTTPEGQGLTLLTRRLNPSRQVGFRKSGTWFYLPRSSQRARFSR